MRVTWAPEPRPSVTWSTSPPSSMSTTLPALVQAMSSSLPAGSLVQGLPPLAQSITADLPVAVLTQGLPPLTQSIVAEGPLLAGTWAGYLDADWQVTMAGSNVAAVGSLDGAIGAVAGDVGPTIDSNWLSSGRRAFQFNGSTQFLTANAFATLVSGNDQPFAIAWQGSINNTSVQQDMWGLGHSTGTAFHEFRNNTALVTRTIRNDDANANFQGGNGGAFPNNSEVVATLSFSGTAMTLTYNGATVVNGTSQNAGVCTFDRFTIGAVLKSVASQFLAGRIRRIAYRTTPFSPADVTALQGWFGT